MGFFATLARRSPAAGPEAGHESSEAERWGYPPGFEAIGEALTSGTDPAMACAVVGRQLAREGVSLHEALAALAETTRGACGTEPSFAATQALSIAWSEATLAFLHQVSCEDPITGLASAAHLRTRLAELYRGELRGRAVANELALVVVDLPVGADHLTVEWLATRSAELVRTVFAGAEPIARLGSRRLVILADRNEHLGRRVALLRRLVEPARPGARTWIERLPVHNLSAELLLDDLATF